MQASTPGGASVLQTLSSDLAGAVERAGQSVVAIHARRRIPASGVIWRPGVVVAANHTIERDEDLSLTLPDGGSAPAELAGRDPGTDLAVLRLQDVEIPAAEHGDAADLRVGHLALALGRPWDQGVTASLGVVSATGSEWRTWHGGRIDRLVRLDIAVRDGFSGGPLVDAGGRVFGINTSALARAAALTVPASTVDRVADQLLATGHVARGYLGLATQPVRLPDTLAHGSGVPGGVGLMVVHVEPGGPADRGGVLLGDVLIALGETPLSDPAEVAGLLGPERVGQPLQARVIRAGQTTTLEVTVGERPRRRKR